MGFYKRIPLFFGVYMILVFVVYFLAEFTPSTVLIVFWCLLVLALFLMIAYLIYHYFYKSGEKRRDRQ